MICDKLIRGGFSFCGTDIADLGLSYAPEKEDTYVYAPAETTVHEETYDGHNGGYLYGVSKQPKEFRLRCYFEDSAIDKGVMSRIYNLFRVGKSGKLIFSRRPWCYYYASVTSLPHPELSNYMNGLVTITMKAYYPYARSDEMYCGYKQSSGYQSLTNDDYYKIMQNTAMPESADMVPQTSFTNITEQTSLLLLNPGTERAHINIIAAGDVGSGVTIYNRTTKQSCKLVGISKAETTYANKELSIDGISGKTVLQSETESKLAFLYHDEGFIELDPAGEAIRHLFVRYYPGTTLEIVNQLEEDVVGRYIYIQNQWRKIIDQTYGSTDRLTINSAVEGTGVEKTMIVSMNELVVTPTTTMSLDKLTFAYKATFA